MNNGLYEHMSVFVAVADARSLTAASVATGIAQPTISRQLTALEKHLGCRLLQRSTRAMSLTAQGEDYLRHARHMLELNDDAQAAVKGTDGHLAGRMRVACSNAFGRKVLIPLLAEWQALHPRLQIDFVLSDQLTHLIEERVDVAFRTAPLQKSSLVARAIGESRRIVVASRGYLRKHGSIRKPEDLRAHQCLVFSGAERPGTWVFEKRSSEVEVRVQGSLTFSTVDALQDAVLADLGVAVMPAWFWTRDQLRNQVTQLLPEYRLPPRTIHALTTRRLSAGSRVRRFVDHVARAFQKRTGLEAHVSSKP